jgi:tRNA G18 (ribose-2'-O)-methylase SpoU
MDELGYFEIGVYYALRSTNIGTLWRSAYQLGAAGIFTINQRYQRQPSDTARTEFRIPLRHYPDMDAFLAARPVGAVLVGVELGGQPLGGFAHPRRAIYLLGSEDFGLPPRVLAQCNAVISIEAIHSQSYNVAVAGSLVMYHRLLQLR